MAWLDEIRAIHDAVVSGQTVYAFVGGNGPYPLDPQYGQTYTTKSGANVVILPGSNPDIGDPGAHQMFVDGSTVIFRGGVLLDVGKINALVTGNPGAMSAAGVVSSAPVEAITKPAPEPPPRLMNIPAPPGPLPIDLGFSRTPGNPDWTVNTPDMLRAKGWTTDAAGNWYEPATQSGPLYSEVARQLNDFLSMTDFSPFSAGDPRIAQVFSVLQQLFAGAVQQYGFDETVKAILAG